MKSILSPLRVALAGGLRGRVLDCGSGEDLFGPCLRRAGNEVVSLDVDPEALRRTPGRTVLAGCTDMPFDDDAFDAVWACAIIEHVTDETLPEMVRVTRPGGRIVAVTPNAHSPFDNVKRLLGLPTWWDNPGHVRLYSARELRAYGPVHGETRFLPLLRWFFWRVPAMAHVLILDCRVTPAVKAAAVRRRRRRR